VKEADGAAIFVVSGSGAQVMRLHPNTTAHACYDQTDGGYYFAGCSSAAEYVPTIDNGQGFPQMADLVSIAPSIKNPYDDDHAPFVVTKSAEPCDANLLGFVLNPESGADGKKLNEHYLPLAIYGYFPAKVTLENGAIKRGDPITSSSQPGYGMKATKACKTIGYALEDADREGNIQVFAHLNEYGGREADQQEQNRKLEARLAALEELLSAKVPASAGNQ
jgi:hypothetical protein